MNRQDFGHKLQRILDDRQWSQADLVRRVKEVTGQAIGRDAISSYVSGRSLPGPKSLNLLSKAIEISPDELLAETTAPKVDTIEIQSAPGQPGKAWLRVNRIVTFETAARVALLINEEDIGAAGEKM